MGATKECVFKFGLFVNWVEQFVTGVIGCWEEEDFELGCKLYGNWTVFNRKWFLGWREYIYLFKE